MSADFITRIANAGELIAAAPASTIGDVLIWQLNEFLHWPFRAASGNASDSRGVRTTSFSSLIFTCVQGMEIAEKPPVSINADTLACAIDVTHTLDLDSLRGAYERLAWAKTLEKSPAASGVLYTTSILGIVFAIASAVPLEMLAAELDRLNRQTSSIYWPDMVVIASLGSISYGLQFPGESAIPGRWTLPTAGALSKHIPPVYIVMAITPSGSQTFGEMIHAIFSHLSIFLPGVNPANTDFTALKSTRFALNMSSYQYNLAGELLPVPITQIQGRMLPNRPFLVQSSTKKTLATLELIEWQDGGVILLRGNLPLDGLMILFGGAAARQTRTITREGLQLSYVLPISAQGFQEMLQRFQRQSNMKVRLDDCKVVVQKLADEGSSSPFIARIVLGILKLYETLPSNKEQIFRNAHDALIANLMEFRSNSSEICTIYREHISKIASGAIVRFDRTNVHVAEYIDRSLARMVNEFLTNSTRIFKDKMQRVINTFDVNIGFLYQKPDTFERQIAVLEQRDAPLAAYLIQARRWGSALIEARNGLEHDGWQLPRIGYEVKTDHVVAVEPVIGGEPVTKFVERMTDRLLSFVEDVTVHCIQLRMPTGLSIREIPLPEREVQIPLRFQPTIAIGGMPIWQITYRESSFDQT